MNYRKAAFGISITLGIIVGIVLGIVSGEFMPGAILGGAILGAVGFVAIDWVVSRRRTSALPYDQLSEHQRGSNPGHNQAPEAQFRQIQDGHINEFMPFRNSKPR